MNFDEYQVEAYKMAIYPKDTFYPVLGLCGEAGEIAEKFKKCLRDKGGIIDEDFKVELVKELGDVLWYIGAICSEYGLSMSDVATSNIRKLKDRQKRGKIQGSGDNR